MRTLIMLAFLLTICCIACQKEENTVELKASGCDNCVNFQSPKIGQESRYLAFEGEKPWEEQPVLRYLKDTLIVKIVGQTGEVFQVEEYRTSAPGDLLHHTFRVEGDTLYLKTTPRNDYPESWLFNNSSAIKLPLQQVSSPIIQPKGWNILVFSESSPATGFLPDYEQLGSVYKNLNVYHDYGPMAYDGVGYYFIYNQKNGMVRSLSLSPWQAKGLGWDLIAE